MTAVRAIEILQNEKACVQKANICGRNCAECDLVLPDTEIIEAYNMAIEELIVSETMQSMDEWIDGVLEIVNDVYQLWSDDKIDAVGEAIAEINRRVLDLKEEQE